jgi:hypothetical protein
MTVNLKESLRAHALSHYPILYLLTHDDTEADELIAGLDPERQIIDWNMEQRQGRQDGCHQFVL